ncbi:MAG: dCMP deaminase family protein [Armatimonadetes bacterium]|nr:dCMP deaminase family protein [Armatimonadota bacterium]
MRIAFEVAKRATCLRRHVGAVIVRDKRILSTGYNGSPPGQPHCTEVGCLLEEGRCVRTLHAEQNALMQAALHGVSTQNATMYATCRPCHVCARMIVAAGIVRVVFAGVAPEGWAREVLAGAGVEIVPMPDIVPPSPLMTIQETAGTTPVVESVTGNK